MKICSVCYKLSIGFYLEILTKITLLCFKMGLVGEFLLILFTLIWMFWPIFLAYKYKTFTLYIISIITSIFLLIKGFIYFTFFKLI